MARLSFNRLDFRILILFFCKALFGDEEITQETVSLKTFPTPWFTGPLLTPSARTVQPGHFNIQPYINALTNVGRYNKHWHVVSQDNFYTLETRLNVKIGLAKRLDLFFAPQILYRERKGEHSVHFGDLPIALDIQLLNSGIESPWPAIKWVLRAEIPSGNYQRLNKGKQRTDVSGTGCWFPGSSLVFGYLLHIAKIHYVDLRWYAGYRFGTPVRVRGMNIYGGDATTRGTEYPGNRLYTGAAIQYNFMQRWAFACDFLYFHENKNRFSGKTENSMRSPSKEQYSLAPAIEYNWNQRVGMIGGIWFSFTGRNAAQFINGMWSINAYF